MWLGIIRASLALQLAVVALGQNNLAMDDEFIYVALGTGGIGVIQMPIAGNISTLVQDVIPPVEGAESVDDVDIADDFLFAVDAQNPGYLWVLSLLFPLEAELVSGPIEAPSEPFSGVSAANGVVVVSGGTSQMAVWNYHNSSEELSTEMTSFDLGVGQPDVLVLEDAVFVSTDFSTDADIPARFGLTVLQPAPPPERLQRLGEVYLDGFGFSEGASSPANFPLQAAEYIAIRPEGVTRYLIVAGGPGMVVLNIQDLSSIQTLDVVDVGFPAIDVAVCGDTAFVVGQAPLSSAIVAVDLSVLPQGTPMVVNEADLGDVCTVTAVDCNREYVVSVGPKCGASGMSHNLEAQFEVLF